MAYSLTPAPSTPLNISYLGTSRPSFMKTWSTVDFPILAELNGGFDMVSIAKGVSQSSVE